MPCGRTAAEAEATLPLPWKETKVMHRATGNAQTGSFTVIDVCKRTAPIMTVIIEHEAESLKSRVLFQVE